MVWIGVPILKKLLLSLLLMSLLFADDVEIEKNIYETIFLALVETEKPNVYSKDTIESLGLRPALFTQVYKCSQADIVVMTKSSIPKSCQDKVVVGTRYRHLRKPYVYGAFFWQKGRPNILFKRTKLEEHNIVLTSKLIDYME